MLIAKETKEAKVQDSENAAENHVVYTTFYTNCLTRFLIDLSYYICLFIAYTSVDYYLFIFSFTQPCHCSLHQTTSRFIQPVQIGVLDVSRSLVT